MSDPTPMFKKCQTGVVGLDEITGGGLPHGRTTLVVGGSGSGKTVLSLQFLVQGAQHSHEPGIFVAFEEHSDRILLNAASFGWQLDALKKTQLHFVDAQPFFDLTQSGDFDLGGMLAALGAKVKSLGARRVVFDALDIVLVLLPDAAAQRREIYRIHAWLLAHDLTGIITLKAGGDDSNSALTQSFGLMQFMMDCVVILSHKVVHGVSQRALRVQKYRGSEFIEDEAPFLIGKTGFEVIVARALHGPDAEITTERVSSGVERLDTMLGGGYFRAASVLLTGYSGTAKTTLSGTFAAAACLRGERTLFISFDSDGSEVTRNLASVGIDFAPHVQSGCLRIVSARAITGSAEVYLARIKSLAYAHQARCLVIDPVSAWSMSSSDLGTNGVAERLIEWSKRAGITLVCTRLFGEMSSLPEGGSPSQISALVDTWIHLNYVVQAGERNRGLSIIKSRGTAHSNQVRELVLDHTGVTLADTYTAGGEVLMGTMRWEKERAERSAHEANDVLVTLRRVKLDAEEAELEVRLKAVQVELTAKQIEKELLVTAGLSRDDEVDRNRIRMDELRGADASAPV